MSTTTVSNINPYADTVSDEAINSIIVSIATEELALAHILNAEGEKLQYVLGTLEGRDPGEVTLCDIMEVNNSIHKTLRDVTRAEMLLQIKLEDIVDLVLHGDECRLSIKGQKIWRDGDNVDGTRPATTEINLLRDGEVYRTVTIDSIGDGAYIFACVPVWRDPENRYTYQVAEAVVPTGYTSTVSGYNITNTVLPGSITINGSKVWVNDDIQVRPAEITVNLLQNETQFLAQTVDSPPAGEDTAPFSFEAPRFDDEGAPFVYTVDEEIVAGYEKSIEAYIITNTLITP